MDDDSVKVALKVGGKYALFGGVTTGKFTAVEKPSVLDPCAQADGKRASLTRLSLGSSEPKGEETRLRLIHSQFVGRQNRDDRSRGRLRHVSS